jgi:DNA-binding transcriptional LysR family regulator
VKVSISDTGDVLHVLERGEAHLGFVGGITESPHLEFQPFATDELVLVVSPRHAWRKRKKVTPQELVEQPIIQREQGSASRRFLERALEQVGLSADTLNVVMELGSSETIVESVREGLGVAILSRRAVQKDVQSKRLHSLRIEGLPLERTLFAVQDRRKAISPAATAFLAMLLPKQS